MSNVCGKTYAINVVTPMKPRWSWANRFFFMFGRAFPSRLSGLLGLSFIHFARWVFVKRHQWPDFGQKAEKLENDYMLFCSNFNGTWDQYIDSFSDGIPNGLDLFWFSSIKYPKSIPITTFKNYICHNQVQTDYYYNATPDTAQRDIKSSLKTYNVIRELIKIHGEGDRQKFAATYVKKLLSVQNNLPAHGCAPIASNDTVGARRNLNLFAKNSRPL